MTTTDTHRRPRCGQLIYRAPLLLSINFIVHKNCVQMYFRLLTIDFPRLQQCQRSEGAKLMAYQ